MGEFVGFSTECVAFLQGLSEPENNSKGWFEARRKTYDTHVKEAGRAFVNALAPKIEVFAPHVHCVPKVGGSIFRINRDTRFSNDKRPYKDHLDMMFWEGAGRSRACPGLFFRLTGSELVIGAGKHGFDKDQLAAWRRVVTGDGGEELQATLAAMPPGTDVGGLHYKKVPRGLPADHPRASLLRHNALYVGVTTPHPESLGSAAITDHVAAGFEVFYPVVRWLLQVTE